MPHYCYMAKCADGTLYTGYTTDLARREQEHNTSPKGAKYTAMRRPVRMVFNKEFATKSEAMQYEYALKQMTREEKLLLICQPKE
jgi:putative endonuclease